MIIEKVSRNVINIRIDKIRAGWEKWFLLSSDRHHDSKGCDKKLVIEHLEMVKEKGGHILDFGDFFDAMQGRYDPRRDYKDIGKRFLDLMQSESIGYLDAIVRDACEFYGPYANLFALISKGNHETAIAKHNEVDLISNLVYGLNTISNSQIQTGMYGGWVRFLFAISTGQRESINLKYFHGSGGGGPVTKGTIQSNRQAVYLPDAQIVVNGHIDESWILALKRERISKQGVISQDYQYHVRTGTYNDPFGDGAEGWHVERGAPPKPKGAVWLKFYYDRKHVHFKLIQELG